MTIRSHSNAGRPPRTPLRPLTLRIATLLASASLASLAPAAAVPPRGSEAPPLALRDLDGVEVDTAQFAGRPLVLIFGELQHERVRRACAEVSAVLDDPRLSREGVVPILVIAQDRPAQELKEEALQEPFAGMILHDPSRRAFGDYRVLVVPSVVVVDGVGGVVYAAPGPTPRFADLLTEALLVATQHESPEQFERSLNLEAQAPQDPTLVRVERLVRMGEQLARRGMHEMAEAQYREALKLRPGHPGAGLALADLLLATGRAQEAERHVRAVLDAQPRSVEATLALVRVHLHGSDERLGEADALLKDVLQRYPSNAAAHYLNGRILERRGECGPASAAYRTAAELLLER